MLKLRQLCVCVGGRDVVRNVDLEVRPGELVALLGANGAGKTSLARAALGLASVAGGTSQIGGCDAHALAPPERARRAAYLPQLRPLAWPVSVRSVVALGRFAYGASPHRLEGQDADAVDQALAACDLAALADAPATTLSGGEQARMHVARALASTAPLLVADEPDASLDVRHQHAVMSAIADFVAGGGAALVVVHDPALAARFAHRLAWMRAGRLIADGPPQATLTSDMLAQVYGVEAQVQDLAGHPALTVNRVLPRP